LDTLLDIFGNMGRYWAVITVWDILDILIVAVAIYKLIQLMRRSNAMQILRGIALLLLLMLLAEVIGLRMANSVLSNAVQIGLFALIVLFQPELRKVLEQMGGASLRGALGPRAGGDMENVIPQTVRACGALSLRREGALIVFERSVLLDDILKTGTAIDAEATPELLENIFFPKAPLHDGAVIVRKGRIAGAGCMLPMTGQLDIGRELGMRHRAGIGVTESSDALAVVVSEETGSISVAKQGGLKRRLTAEELNQILRQELTPKEDEAQRGLSRLLWRPKRKKP
jgi:diadenylate cyclase